MFGRKKQDPKELAREAKRTAKSGERDMDKELRALERQEAAIIADIKKTAKTGNKEGTRTLAKQLVQLRSQKERLTKARAAISAVGFQATGIASQATMAATMASVAGVMKGMNNAMPADQIAKNMAEFARQSETMEFREDLINDALTDAFYGEEAEAEADGIVNEVLDELGLQVGQNMPDMSQRRPAAAAADTEAQAKRAAMADEDAALDAKTEALLKQLQGLSA
ncbi:unnamed protein product [Phaeothamnion confervicola]